MIATPTRSTATANLTRWQARLASAQATYRKRAAEARQLYPANEGKQRAYCERQQRDCSRYAAFVAQAAGHVEPEAAAEAPAPPKVAPLGWWARFWQHWHS